MTDKLKEVALQEISRKGYAQVKVSDVARQAGVTPAMIYYYYRDKEALCSEAIHELAEKLLGDFEALCTQEMAPSAAIDKWLQNHIDYLPEIRQMARACFDLRSAARDQAAAEALLDRFYELERRCLEKFISAGVQSGEFRHCDPKSLRSVITGFLDGVVVYGTDPDARATIVGFRKMLWGYLEPQTS